MIGFGEDAYVNSSQAVVPKSGDDVDHVGPHDVLHLLLPVRVHAHVHQQPVPIAVGREVLEEERERHKGPKPFAVLVLVHLVRSADELAVDREMRLPQIEGDAVHLLALLVHRGALLVKVVVLHEAEVPRLLPQELEVLAPLFERQQLGQPPRVRARVALPRGLVQWAAPPHSSSPKPLGKALESCTEGAAPVGLLRQSSILIRQPQRNVVGTVRPFLGNVKP
eukprot:1582425-Pyramimonas_sp.AAC.1